MRNAALVLLGITALFAQADWAGAWKGANLTLTIQSKGGSSYAGVIAMDGQNLPFTAQAAGGHLDGTFTADGERFPFSVRRLGDGRLALTSEGETYELTPAGPPRPRNPLAGPAAVPSPAASLVGDWQGPRGLARFGADGSLLLAGETYRYAVQGSTLLLIANDGQVPVPIQLSGDTLTMGQGPQAIRLTRLAAGAPVGGTAPRAPAGRGGVLPELVGKWCYQANVYATNGGARSSSQCFVLNADGTYEYSGESDSYNPNGGSTSQSYDAGTWTATESTITANSRSKGSTTYRLEKRNHPTNVNDPMLVLDGQAFVTAWQKAPWR
ncbi:MAG TPA: hypothetical protein DEH78_29575 [Solibacterales bacterium]|nr:hypothetical protein [Bryobacterales bacterium]